MVFFTYFKCTSWCELLVSTNQILGYEHRWVGAGSVVQMHWLTLLLLDALEKKNRKSQCVLLFLSQIIFTSKCDLLVKYGPSPCQLEDDMHEISWITLINSMKYKWKAQGFICTVILNTSHSVPQKTSLYFSRIQTFYYQFSVFCLKSTLDFPETPISRPWHVLFD